MWGTEEGGGLQVDPSFAMLAHRLHKCEENSLLPWFRRLVQTANSDIVALAESTYTYMPKKPSCFEKTPVWPIQVGQTVWRTHNRQAE